jgi:signal transduction histidine kinase/ActR/RegA family two-component response regulator
VTTAERETGAIVVLVRQMMTRPVITVTPDSTVADVRRLFDQHRIHHLPVVLNGRLVGMVSERDLRSPGTLNGRPVAVGGIMTANPITVSPHTRAETAARLLIDHKIGALPVIDGDELAGIVTGDDLLRALVAVLGGPVFGHPERAIFTEREERLVVGLATQAAIAMDNARLYEKEQRARTEAEAANRSKDEFLATLSHELRTPLTAVLGWARMLRSGRLEPGTHERAIDVIERNAQAQVQLIEDLLDVSRIITGKMRLDVRPVNLPVVVEAAMDSVRPAAESKGVRLTHVLDPKAGPVAGDPDRLQQIVWNLALNAIKFTDRGGRVQVNVQRVSSQVEIVVSDTGRGIAADVLPHIFERFHQADSTTTRAHRGLGIGLALVRHLVELHGGTVHAESPGENQGAVFTVRLPIMAHTDAAAAAEHRHPTAIGGRSEDITSLEGLNLLVVDDEADALELFAAMLTQKGATVRSVNSAAAALRMLSEWMPDVLISDIGMPAEDGYVLIRKVRALEEASARIPAIAVTAYGSVEDRIRVLSAGFDAHVPKPLEPAELAVVITSLLARRR